MVGNHAGIVKRRFLHGQIKKRSEILILINVFGIVCLSCEVLQKTSQDKIIPDGEVPDIAVSRVVDIKRNH